MRFWALRSPGIDTSSGAKIKDKKPVAPLESILRPSWRQIFLSYGVTTGLFFFPSDCPWQVTPLWKETLSPWNESLNCQSYFLFLSLDWQLHKDSFNELMLLAAIISFFVWAARRSWNRMPVQLILLDSRTMRELIPVIPCPILPHLWLFILCPSFLMCSHRCTRKKTGITGKENPGISSWPNKEKKRHLVTSWKDSLYIPLPSWHLFNRYIFFLFSFISGWMNVTWEARNRAVTAWWYLSSLQWAVTAGDPWFLNRSFSRVTPVGYYSSNRQAVSIPC